MRFPNVLSLFTLICAFSPSVVLARGGRGRGGGGAGDVIGNATSNLSLEPIVAAIFAFAVIFATFTALQALGALGNIRRRIGRQPPSITLPEFSVGPIFPAFLLLSTLLLTTAYVLHAVFWAVRYNQNATSTPEIPVAFGIAWNIMGFLADIFLVSAILALINHREKVLVNTPRMFRDIKMIVDALFIVILLSLSMATVGLSFMTEPTTADLQMSQNLYTAYISFFLIVVVDIAVSSVVLYVRSRHSTVNDHNTSLYLSFIVSPLFIIYALYPIVALGLQKSGVLATPAQWDLSNLVVDCVTEFIVIATCLRFGMPIIPKKGVEEKHHHKGYEA